MKKLYGYLLIAAGFLTIVSCDKDSDYEAPVSSINVVSAETYLSAAGETKSIVLDNTPASVYAQDAWLTVTNEGNKVNLTAEANTSIQSRNTEVVVKSTAGDSIMVTVSQGGSVFKLKDKSDLFSPDTEVTKTYSVMSNLPITCTPTADWITVTSTANSFTVSATANTSGKPRVGYVKVASGSFVDSIKVLQVKASDLIADYQLVCQTIQNKKLVTVAYNAKLEAVSNDSVLFNIDNFYKWKGKFEKDGTITFKGMQIIATTTDKNGAPLYLVPLILDTDFKYARDASISFSAVIGNNGWITFKGNGTVAGKETPSFLIGAYNNADLANRHWIGLFDYFITPVLVRQ